MEKISQETNVKSARNLLLQVVEGIIPKEKSEWMREKVHEVENQITDNKFYQILGKIPSLFSKERIGWSSAFLQKANQIEEGWNPRSWTIDQAVRIIILLSKGEANPDNFERLIRKYHQTADLGEQVFINLALPVLPHKEKFTDLAALGVRSNMKVVFEAISLENSYPHKFFDLSQWNQLVLKALFIGSPLYRIYGLDERSNAKLAAMLCDYAHERWAAGRKVSPELWRPVGSFINETVFEDILKLAAKGDELEKEAAALASYSSEYQPAHDLLDKNPHLTEKIRSGELTWTTIGERWVKLQD